MAKLAVVVVVVVVVVIVDYPSIYLSIHPSILRPSIYMSIYIYIYIHIIYIYIHISQLTLDVGTLLYLGQDMPCFAVLLQSHWHEASGVKLDASHSPVQPLVRALVSQQSHLNI